MIYCYNPQHVGDVLLIIAADAAEHEVSFEQHNEISRVYKTTDNQTVGWNIFAASRKLGTINGNGQVVLSEAQIQALNQLLLEAGYTDQFDLVEEPKLAVGLVQSCEPHPDSDHLSITQTEVDHGKVLQIVCGAPNVAAGMKVVVAKPGAMMPDGMMIWPGKLRGVQSDGMLCSARELHIPNAPQVKGIMELAPETPVGEIFLPGR